MIGIIVWLLLILWIMSLVMPQIWLVLLIVAPAVLLLMWLANAVKENYVTPRLERIAKKRRVKQLARWEEIDRQVERDQVRQQREKAERRRQARMLSKGLVWTTPTTDEERERAIDEWERKWKRKHPSRINR